MRFKQLGTILPNWRKLHLSWRDYLLLYLLKTQTSLVPRLKLILAVTKQAEYLLNGVHLFAYPKPPRRVFRATGSTTHRSGTPAP